VCVFYQNFFLVFSPPFRGCLGNLIFPHFLIRCVVLSVLIFVFEFFFYNACWQLFSFAVRPFWACCSSFCPLFYFFFFSRLLRGFSFFYSPPVVFLFHCCFFRRVQSEWWRPFFFLTCLCFPIGSFLPDQSFSMLCSDCVSGLFFFFFLPQRASPIFFLGRKLPWQFFSLWTFARPFWFFPFSGS